MILLFDFRQYVFEIGGGQCDVVWICNLQLTA